MSLCQRSRNNLDNNQEVFNWQREATKDLRKPAVSELSVLRVNP